MSSRSLMVLLLLSVILISGVCVLRSCRPAAPGLGAGLSVEEAVAYRFGRVIADRLPGDGPVVVVQLPAQNPTLAVAAKHRLAALERGLGGGLVVVASPETMDPAALGDLVMRTYDGRWGQDLTQWLASQPKTRAVVSFMGIPGDMPEDAFLPPLLAVRTFSGGRSVEELFQRKTVFAVAVPRPDADFKEIPPAGAKPDEIFDARYILRTAETP